MNEKHYQTFHFIKMIQNKDDLVLSGIFNSTPILSCIRKFFINSDQISSIKKHDYS